MLYIYSMPNSTMSIVDGNLCSQHFNNIFTDWIVFFFSLAFFLVNGGYRSALTFCWSISTTFLDLLYVETSCVYKFYIVLQNEFTIEKKLQQISLKLGLLMKNHWNKRQYQKGNSQKSCSGYSGFEKVDFKLLISLSVYFRKII